MKYIVGSLNPIKIGAVVESVTARELFGKDTALLDLEVSGFGANSGVSEQPRTLEETVLGAHNRARAAGDKHGFWDGHVFVGIESGLMQVKAGSYFDYELDVCACAIVVNGHWSLGLSGAWVVPVAVRRGVSEGLDLDAATKFAGLTQKDRVGHEEGLVGILTKGQITRKTYTRQAIDMALVDAWPHITRKAGW
jgi:inosine/xanthosine triphosphatase